MGGLNRWLALELAICCFQVRTGQRFDSVLTNLVDGVTKEQTTTATNCAGLRGDVAQMNTEWVLGV